MDKMGELFSAGEMKKSYKILVGKCEEKSPPG
jgi:hypothetical protein